MRRHLCKARTVLLATTITVAMTPIASHASDGTHEVVGLIQLRGGVWLGIDARELPDGGTVGTAWITDELPPQATVEISIDCLEVSWYAQPYPLPPYLPYHRVEASGIADDGQRYHLAAYDWVARPLSYGDYAALALEPGRGACGAPTISVRPAHAGDIAVIG